MACLRRSLVFKSVILSSNLQFRYFESTMWLPQILCLFLESCAIFVILSQQNQVAQNSSGFVFCGLSFLEHDSLFRAMQFRSFEFTRSSCAEFLWFFTILLNTHTHNNNGPPYFVEKGPQASTRWSSSSLDFAGKSTNLLGA